MKIRKATREDIGSIKSLQEKNHYENVSENEKEKEGFVSVKTNEKLLEEIIKTGTFVSEEENKITGYIFPLTKEQAKQIPILNPFLERFSRINYNNKKISEQNWIVVGQICIEKENRGKGIIEGLWKNFKEYFNNKYDLIVSEVSTSNPKSIHVCTNKLNFEIAETYNSEGKEWYVLAYDLKKLK